MDNPIEKIVAFHNELMRYETYDYSHVLHPDHQHIDKDDVMALLKDFWEIDKIYGRYIGSIDLSLQLKAHIARDPVMTRVSEIFEMIERGEPPTDWTAILDAEQIMTVVRYPNALRDIAREQIRRYEDILGKGEFESTPLE